VYRECVGGVQGVYRGMYRGVIENGRGGQALREKAATGSAAPALYSSPLIRGSHSSTFQLNWRASYGIGGARRGRVAHDKVVLRGV